MEKNTSVLLGDYFDNFIASQIETGRYSSAGEVVKAALRLFEDEENKKRELVQELKEGEASGFIEHFDRSKFLQVLHENQVAHRVQHQ